MTRTGPYNGHANYPTWAVALWLDNDYDLYHESRSLVGREAELWTNEADPKPTVEFYVGEALERWIQEMTPPLDGMWADLLQYAWEEVDWKELADGYLAEYREEQEAGR